MSIDIDLTSDDDLVHVAILNSAGVYRVFVRIGNGKLQLSAPLTPDGLKELKQLLTNDDLDEYEEIYQNARANDIRNGQL